MVEMELHSVYKQVEKQSNNFTRITTAKNSFDNVHLSLNGGFGVSYNLKEKWNIHFEPRIACSQPKNIHTKHFNRYTYFGVNLGMNYKIAYDRTLGKARPLHDNNIKVRSGTVIAVPSL
jgi:hypothetical protein